MTPPRRRPQRRPAGRTEARNIRRTFRIILLIFAIAAGAIVRCQTHRSPEATPTPTATQGADNATYGNLLDVRTAPGLDSYPKAYTGFNLSFNPKLHIPNWVAWELSPDETDGVNERSDNFAPDTSVPGCPTLDDYRRSGYDRGHMAPAGDMKWSQQAMSESFLLSNILPQNRKVNMGSWGKLEAKCRAWAKRLGPLYVVSGPVITPTPLERIGRTGVYVPRQLFKVIIAPNANPRRGIAFLMPNTPFDGGMQACVVTIDSIEALTGHDFFASLPDPIEADLESQANFNAWPKK